VLGQTRQPGTEPDKRETPTGTITGKVVNENGQPLPSAVVYLRESKTNGAGQSVATDREGAFQLSGLEQSSSYLISASMPAYVNPLATPGSAGPSAYRVGDSVTLTLVKGGVITGTVLNAAGEPMIGVVVRAHLVSRTREGRRLSGSSRERETDDRGIYRLYGLPPGTYVVSAGGAAMSYSSSTMDPYDSDVPTFAPSATRDTASEINVRPGDEISGIDIRYRDIQGRTVSGSVSGSNQGYNVTLTAVGESSSFEGFSFPERNGQSFTFVGVPEGDYDLYAHTYSPTRDYGLSEVKRIRVRDADVTGIELTPVPLASVAGRVVLEETKVPECVEKPRPSFDAMTVAGWHNDTEEAKEIPRAFWSFGVPVKPDEQGNFRVQNLAPGEYYFVTRVAEKNWYVRSIQLMTPGAKKPIDATRTWTNLKIGDRLSGLTITLVPGGASFRGQITVNEGEVVPPRIFVYLVPAERERVEGVLNYFGTPVTADGKIAMNNIVPGRYLIFAHTIEEDDPVPLSRIRFPNGTETRAQLRREAEAAKIEIEFKPCQDVVGFKLPLKPSNQ
jgi:hypothetical protein